MKSAAPLSPEGEANLKIISLYEGIQGNGCWVGHKQYPLHRVIKVMIELLKCHFLFNLPLLSLFKALISGDYWNENCEYNEQKDFPINVLNVL